MKKKKKKRKGGGPCAVSSDEISEKGREKRKGETVESDEILGNSTIQSIIDKV